MCHEGQPHVIGREFFFSFLSALPWRARAVTFSIYLYAHGTDVQPAMDNAAFRFATAFALGEVVKFVLFEMHVRFKHPA